MSDLLKKGKQSAADRVDESRVVTPVPKQIYSERSTLLTSATENQAEMERARKVRAEYRESTKKKQTTSRVTYYNLNKVNSLIATGHFSSFNNFVEVAVGAIIESLSNEERREVEFMIESYEDQQRRAEEAKAKRKK